MLKITRDQDRKHFIEGKPFDPLKEKKSMDKLDGVIAIQCDNGNLNYSEYAFGFANGLILAKSILTGEEPEFMKQPDEWLCDGPTRMPETTPEEVGRE